MPAKIDIGAIYTTRPADKKTSKPSEFKPIKKELVFDIDLKDYDDIRTCCSGGDICSKCWKFMTIAIKIIDAALKEDFGFKHLLWVYSGRCGVHCWVCDESARTLNNSERKAITSYLEIIKGGAQVEKKVNLRQMHHLHPFIRQSLDTVNQYFDDLILKDQDVLKDESCWNKVLGCIPNEETRNTLKNCWSENPSQTSLDRWKDLVNELNSATGKKGKGKFTRDKVGCLPREIILQYTYPRLNEAVSININHLLKTLFWRVCVPIPPETCDDFNPLNVSTIKSLIKELDRFGYEKISLNSHIEYFEHFVQNIEAGKRDK
nr:2849_t:CDS:10 [Entrophospora candida]